jgi:hypothetical protein
VAQPFPTVPYRFKRSCQTPSSMSVWSSPAFGVSGFGTCPPLPSALTQPVIVRHGGDPRVKDTEPTGMALRTDQDAQPVPFGHQGRAAG